ncbi:MAG: pirin family protein [Bacteroidota bacterium]
MSYRTINKIISAQKVNMGGHLLDQPLPAEGVDYIDPFLLIHHWDKAAPGGLRPQEVGVPPHPHRGFSPVTFIYKGDLQHRDSLGNNAVVRAGGTQWMHAGRGITHSERPSKEFAAKGGENEFIQFWVNTPAAYKMEIPYYLPLSKEDTPMVKLDRAEVAVVAGTFGEITGPAKTYSPQLLLRVNAQSDADLSIDVPPSFNALVYLLDGELEIDGQTVSAKDMVWLNNDAESVHVKANTDTRFIILSGEPIDEPVQQYGPFVMNNQTEVMQAIRDAQMGKMGVLIEEFGS